jgi:hypothetical protein
MSSIDHVRVVSNGAGIYVQSGSDSLSASNTSAYSTGDGYSAAFAIAEYPTAGYTATLRNLTAVATDQYSSGLAVSVSDPAGAHAVHVDVHNSIFRAPHADISVGAQDADDVATVVIDHSNFETVEIYGNGMKSVTSPITDGNQTADPLFADLSTGDLHEKIGSPTIDAGAADAANGATDLDGNARTLGSTTDIGATEYVPAAVDTGDRGSQGSGDPSANGSTDSPPSGGAETTTSAPRPTVVPVVTRPPRCVVPKLAGKTLKAAKTVLRRAHCAVGKVTRKTSTRKAGRVLKQAAKPGSRLRSGSKVALVIARSN